MTKNLLIVTDFYTPHKSGIITYIDLFITHLKLQNIKITILTTKHNINDSDIEHYNGVKIIRCKPFIKISRGFYSIELVLKFSKISKEFDIINIHLPLTELFPLVFFMSKKKSITTFHCLPEFPLYAVLIKFYFYFCAIFSMIRSEKIIVLSKDYFKSIFFHKIFYSKTVEISPYVITQKKNLSLKIGNKNMNIGYLGRLSNEKGLEYLIQVSNKMLSKGIKHELIIAGNDKDKRFYNYISSLKNLSSNNPNIKFIGYINEQKKDIFYKNIDLFVLPSINSFEAFGIVQLEAMSYGIPVIASNICGVRTIVNNTQCGLLFEKKNVRDLYNKIVNFKQNKFNPEIIKLNLEKHYNKDKFENQISELFKSM